MRIHITYIQRTAPTIRLLGCTLLLILTVALASCANNYSVGVDAEDQLTINAASCGELLEEYPDYLAAENELAANIKDRVQTQVATNLIGAATLATLGLGLFSFDDTSDATAALAELRAIRIALNTAIQTRGCK